MANISSRSNESATGQFLIDFVTAAPTGFGGNQLSPAQWRSIKQLNGQRSRSINQILEHSRTWGSVSPSVWSERTYEHATRLDVPIISLEKMGISADEHGFLHSHLLEQIGSGKEATAWLDKKTNCVYKLFDARPGGHLGEKIEFTMVDDYSSSVCFVPAILSDILDKLQLLHLIGGCPTEIVGLAGGYLIAKQPCCVEINSIQYREEAVNNASLLVKPGGSYGSQLWIFYAEKKHWALSDLHKKNFARSASGHVLIIDAHIGLIPAEVLKKDASIARAACEAYRVAGFGDGQKFTLNPCRDDEL